MPCSDCVKKQQVQAQTLTRQFFPGLDSLDMALTIAYTEVPVQHRENIDLMRQLVQKMRLQSAIPSEAQWNALLFVLQTKILPYINCPYCRTVTYLHLGSGIRVHMLFEAGKYLEGTKLMIRLDVLKYWWMLKAGYYRLLQPKILKVFK